MSCVIEILRRVGAEGEANLSITVPYIPSRFLTFLYLPLPLLTCKVRQEKGKGKKRDGGAGKGKGRQGEVR